MKQLIAIFCITLFCACTSIEDRPSIPDNILSQEKMAEVMVDVHLLEAALNVNAYNRDQIVTNPIIPNSDVLKKNNVTKKHYEESFAFYSKNPLLLTEVYQLVLNNLSKMQAEVMNQK